MHIRYQRQTAVFALLAFLLMICIGGSAYYYFFVHPRYGIHHEELMAPDTALRVVFKPVLVQKYVSSLAPTGSSLIPGIPKVSSMQQMHFRTEWIHKMPFEISFLLDQRASDELGVLFFVKEHPASESFADLLETGGFFRATRPILWDRNRISSYGVRGLAATGKVQIPQLFQQQRSQLYPHYSPIKTPSVKGRHFLEAALNNTNGTLIELLGAFTGPLGPVLKAQTEKALITLSPAMKHITVTASMAKADLLQLQVTIQCQDSNQADEVLSGALDTAYDVAAYAAREGFTLYWESRTKDKEVYLEGELSDFESKIRRAMGG